MKAIILSAGQGSRLGPWTAELPKCLLPVRGDDCILQLQLEALAACGVREATVVVGFSAARVEAFLETDPVSEIHVRTLFNPFYAVSDNLASCWLARREMRGEFLLLNGDTLFEPELLARLLDAPRAPLTLAIDEKDEYDADDMKVSRVGDRLRTVGKDLAPSLVNGESIGLMWFRDVGPDYFRHALACAVREPRGIDRWYLSVVARMAEETAVRTCTTNGLWWAEIDTPEDLAEARAALRVRRHAPALARPRPSVAARSRAGA